MPFASWFLSPVFGCSHCLRVQFLLCYEEWVSPFGKTQARQISSEPGAQTPVHGFEKARFADVTVLDEGRQGVTALQASMPFVLIKKNSAIRQF